MKRLSIVQRSALVGVSLLASVALVGCAPNENDAASAERPEASVTVGRGDIVSVITLPAMVVAAASFPVAAPAQGSVSEVRPHSLTFVSKDGTATQVQAPEGSEFLRPLVPLHTVIPAQYPIAEARYHGFALRARIDGPAIFRLYSPPAFARGQIEHGPGPFDCRLLHHVPSFGELSEAQAEGWPGGPGGGMASLSVLCAIPPELSVFAGMPAILALAIGEARNVLYLPVEAVAGSAQRGQVFVRTAAGVELRDVQLGLTDGMRIEVKGGLSEGDIVVLPAPHLTNGRR